MKLTQAIITYILEQALPLIKTDAALKQFVSVEYEDIIRQHALYAAYLSLTKENSPKIDAYLLDLSIETDNSYLLLLKDSNDLSIILKMIDDEYEFLLNNKSATILQQANTLVELELRFNYGWTWYPHIGDLDPALINILESNVNS